MTISEARRARSPLMTRQTKVLLAVIFVMGGLLGWEYRILNLHHTSLARLQSELERRQTLQEPLTRDEVESFLRGAPRKRSTSGGDMGGIFIDYYTWRGLVHHSHISVESRSSGEVVKVEDSLFGGTEFQERNGTPAAQVPIQATSPEQVRAALEHAEGLLLSPNATGWADLHFITKDTTNFESTLRSVFDGLPELKVSTVKGEPRWNSVRIPRDGRRLFAFRFTVPFDDPAVLDYVRMAHAKYARVLSRSDPPPGYANRERFLEGRRMDLEYNVDIEGFERLEFAISGSWSLKEDWPGRDFILWFDMGDYAPDRDFELKTALFLSKADEAPMRRGFHEVCDFIGLKTSVPTFAATPEGVRDAISAFDQRLKSNSMFTATCGRIFRPVMAALPEATVNVTTGEVHWQKLDFSNGNLSAVRIRIPESIGDNVDLYGAFVGTRPGRYGWDWADRYEGDFESRTVLNAQVEDPLPPAPNRLTVFSHTNGVLKSGEEVILWFQQEPSPSGQPPEPVFFTLTAVPHGEPSKAKPSRKIKAQQAWLCGKLLGVAVPLPVAPEGCAVLGMHERRIDHLTFTPDSRRLLSCDEEGRINIWNIESQRLEGHIDLPPISNFMSDLVTISPDSKTLFVFDSPRRSVLRWDLDSREPVPALDGLTSRTEKLEAAAFGSRSDQLVLAISEYVGSRSQFRFVTHDLKSGETVKHSAAELVETASLMFIPPTKMFAFGSTRIISDLEKMGSQRIRAGVQLFSEDFASRNQEFSLSEDPPQFSAQDMIPVRFAYHPAGRRLAAICESGQLKVWDVGTGVELLATKLQYEPDWRRGYTAGVATPNLHVSLSADGETVAAASPTNPAVSLWNISDGQHRLAWQADDVPVTHVTHSSDGKWIATANTDGAIRLWKNAP